MVTDKRSAEMKRNAIDMEYNLRDSKSVKKEESLTEKIKRSPDERHTKTHGSLTDTFDNHRCLSQSEESKCI